MRILPLVVAAVIAATGASAATTDSVQVYRFITSGTQDSQSTLKIGTVVAEAAGVIEVYDHRLGTPGRLLASQPFEAGTTPSVRVPLRRPAPR
jgi:hypothetical protein